MSLFKSLLVSRRIQDLFRGVVRGDVKWSWCYQAITKQRKFANTLSKEFKYVKKCYSYFEFELEQDALSKPLLVNLISQ